MKGMYVIPNMEVVMINEEGVIITSNGMDSGYDETRPEKEWEW